MKKPKFKKYLSLKYLLALCQLSGALTLLSRLIPQSFFINLISQINSPEYLSKTDTFSALLAAVVFILPSIVMILSLFSSFEIVWRNKFGNATITSLILQLPFISSSFIGYKIGLGLIAFIFFGFSEPTIHSEAEFAIGAGFKGWINKGEHMPTMLGINVVAMLFLIYVIRARRANRK